MTDLEALLDLPYAVSIGGREVEVRSIRMRDVPRICTLADRVGPALWQADTVMLTTWRRPEFIDYLAAAAGVERPWLADQSGEALLTLFIAVRELNAVLFPQPGETHDETATHASQAYTWADLFTVLISRGHNAAHLSGYGVAQFHAFLHRVEPSVPPTTHKPVLKVVI